MALAGLLSRAWVRELLLGVGLLCGAAALLCYPQEAMEAARSGLALCGNVIIPSLFPFFVLSALVVELGLAGALGRLLEPLMERLFRVSGSCASAVALGFLGGYPVGARTAIELYRKGMCSKTEAQRLLAFCNNSGPAFILGVVGTGVFASSRAGLLLYLAHAAASVCVGLLFRFYRGEERRAAGRSRTQVEAKRFSAAFTGAVGSGLTSVLNICAFVVLFTVIIRLLVLSGVLPVLSGAVGLLLAPLGVDQVWVQRLLTGLLEVSTGVSALAGEGALSGRLTLAAFLLGWAGLSVHCQVLSFLGGSGLSPRTYLVGKFLHGLLAALFTAGLSRVLPLGSVPAILAGQVADLASVDFQTALTWSTVWAWLAFLLFLGVALWTGGKKSGHRAERVI
ncbi:nucleoside recognition domain-containing protein [Pseudoflavonifractor phocaeensis]|uniref:nucleoside recognition domain-containing protein n=1 Tax=Pseudoflavonifractor phocaeensis TaxID=1870988 RepID=UPI001FB04004|nr:nucleoside recognition domain-containing protein [Pseudoflavonifractor phocaeensis]